MVYITDFNVLRVKLDYRTQYLLSISRTVTHCLIFSLRFGIVGSFRDEEVGCSAADLKGSNSETCD